MSQFSIEQAIKTGAQHHQAGRFAEAENLYRQVLAIAPSHPDALHLLGVMAAQARRTDEAIDLIGRAIAANPNAAEFRNNLGGALREKGRLDESIDVLQRAVRLKPNYADAQRNLRSALDEKQRQLDEAIESCRRAVTQHPGSATAQFNLGMALIRQGKYEQATAANREAIRLDRKSAVAFHALGFALGGLNRHDDAIAAYRQALCLDPNFADAHMNLGNAFVGKKQFSDAVASYQKSLLIKPQDANNYFNLGYAFAGLGDLNASVAAYRKALQLKPDYHNASNNLGSILEENGEFDEAITVYEQALHFHPDSAETHWNLSLVLLLKGQFTRGWRECEWRWKWKDLPVPGRNLPQKKWDGGDLHGLTILLHAEQGFGDTIQFIRYVPMVARRGGKMLLSCPPALSRLLKSGFDIEQVPHGAAFPPFDVHCPLMTLPLIFNTQLDTIPGSAPYLKADPILAERWARRLASSENGLRVGLVWAGSNKHPNDAARSMTFKQLAPLSKVKGVRFYSLQIGPAAAEVEAASPGFELIDFTCELKDFAETAAMISQLDLVITVDTAVAHLAGAMGKPVWVLLWRRPDWRWMLDREDSPWYPTMRLFRQSRRGDWAAVVDEVSAALAAWRPQQLATAEMLRIAMWHHTSARLDEALQAYQQILDRDPGNADALHLTGVVHAQAGNPELAVRWIERAIANCRTFPEFYVNLAAAKTELRHFDEAITAYRKALLLNPDHPGAKIGLVGVLIDKGLIDDAINVLQEVLRITPDSSSAHFQLGRAFFVIGKSDDAAAEYRESIRIAPAYAEPHNGLAIILSAQEKPDAAMAEYREAIRLNPRFASAHCNLGNLLGRLGRNDEGFAELDRALQLDPRTSDVHSNRGLILADVGRRDEAMQSFRQALRIDPGHAEARSNLSMLMLQLGDFQNGWREHESRWNLKAFRARRRDFSRPQWDGRPLNGRRILIYAEQGYGDTLQFSRYIPMVAQRGGDVIFECRPELLRLIHCIKECDAIPSNTPLPDFDFHAPLLSLPLIFETRLETIPASVPYLIPDAESVVSFAARMAKSPARLRVGLTWAGNPNHKKDHFRSLELCRLAPLTSVVGVRFFSLQKYLNPMRATRPLPGMDFIDWTTDMSDFADTAALIANLDLVISVDTAVAHLAGAMGKPVWLLLQSNPDWRWLLDRDDSPWYPTMRLFRQKDPGDWTEVIERVADALRNWNAPDHR